MQVETESGMKIKALGTVPELLDLAGKINEVDPIKEIKIKKRPDPNNMPSGIIASGRPKKKKRKK